MISAFPTIAVELTANDGLTVFRHQYSHCIQKCNELEHGSNCFDLLTSIENLMDTMVPQGEETIHSDSCSDDSGEFFQPLKKMRTETAENQCENRDGDRFPIALPYYDAKTGKYNRQTCAMAPCKHRGVVFCEECKVSLCIEESNQGTCWKRFHKSLTYS